MRGRQSLVGDRTLVVGWTTGGTSEAEAHVARNRLDGGVRAALLSEGE